MIRAGWAPTTDRERLVVDLQADHDLDRQLWWETTSGEPPPLPDRLDAVALTLLPKAMSYRQDLHLEGPVAWSVLANAEEYIDAWSMWLPDLFGRVSVTADEVIDDRHDGPGPFPTTAVTAFSGGVDGTYATYAHSHGLLGRRSLSVAAAVQVHGFDIPIDDHEGFALASEAARRITDEIGVPLITMRTNWKTVADPHWEMTFGAALAGVLHHFTDRAGVACVAADNTYPQTTIPWGTNPITGPLLSSRRMRHVHTGAGVGRTQKCQALGHLSAVRAGIRVCWAGQEAGRNCGRCEKCVRTKVNFMAAGHGAIEALGPFVPGELRTQIIKSEAALGIYRELLDDIPDLPGEVAEELVWLLEHQRGDGTPSMPDAETPDPAPSARRRPWRR